MASTATTVLPQPTSPCVGRGVWGGGKREGQGRRAGERVQAQTVSNRWRAVTSERHLYLNGSGIFSISTCGKQHVPGPTSCVPVPGFPRSRNGVIAHLQQAHHDARPRQV
jgi:hypothetical protein